MAGKKSGGVNAEDAARRRLVKLQGALQAAQQHRSQVKVEGEQDVENARKRAERRLDKATERVERLAGDLARAEHVLRELQTSHAGTAPTRAHAGESDA